MYYAFSPNKVQRYTFLWLTMHIAVFIVGNCIPLQIKIGIMHHKLLMVLFT